VRYRPFDSINKPTAENISGVSIAAANVTYETIRRRYSHTDCPSNIDYVKTMITGVPRMDGAILVIAATDGPMPQTREHLLMLRQIEVSRIVVYLNKCDAVKDAELLDLVELEVRELLSNYGFTDRNLPIVRGSALGVLNELARWEKTVDDLLAALDTQPLPEKTAAGPSQPHLKFDAHVYMLNKEEGGRSTPIASGYRPQIHIGTIEITGLVQLKPATPTVAPGSHADINVELLSPVAMAKGMRFAINEGGKTVGLGVITAPS
jgi:elongation factor Tu